jgi:hypothetical protein
MPGPTKTTISTIENLVKPVLGSVDLDPAANSDNCVGAKTFWDGTVVDGLVPAWAPVARTIWLVPPKRTEELHNHTLTQWVARAYKESRAGATILALLPSKTGVGWFHNFVTRSAAFTLIHDNYDVDNWGQQPQLSVLWSSDSATISKYERASEKRGLLVMNG